MSLSDEVLLSGEGLQTWYPIRAGLMRRVAGWVQAATDVSLEVRAGQTLALVAHGASNLEPSIGALAVLASIGAWLYALVAWWQNRRLGLDGVMKRAHTIPAIG